MAAKKIIAICQSGGEFVTNNEDGSLSYTGGNAYAVDIDEKTNVDAFKQELGDTFKFNVVGMTIKYFLPGNKKTLITVSKDKDLRRMVNFFKDSEQVEVFVIAEGAAVALNVSNMPASRSSRTTMPDPAVSPATPLDFTNPDGQLMVDTPMDTTTPLGICSNDDKHRRAATQWENSITGVDQRFSSFTEFREVLHKYSIAHGFTYNYKKNDSHRVTVKCKSEGCPWRIYASRLVTTQLIFIKKMNKNHTCEGAVVKAGYRATRGWVGNIIKEKLKFSPDYKPKDIATDIKREYGIQLNYSQSWRAKEIAREQLQGSYREAYSQLPSFCERIMETNPGSLATFVTKEDSSFHRLFVSFHASIYGFQQGCRPLLFLDSTVLYAKYQGIVLSAVGADGNDGVLPVAFAVVDEETDDNWHWFLSELKSAISTSRPITFVSAFQNGIRESLCDIFGKDSYHGYCLRHLGEKLNKDLHGKFSHEARCLLIQDLYAAAYAPKLEDFERCVENIKAISPDAYSWVVQSEPDHWVPFLVGQVTQMVDALQRKMMELNYTRRVDSSLWLTRLTPSMEEKLQNETSKSMPLQACNSHESTFEVRGEAVDLVDIDNWFCSCKAWQLSGLPCCHAIAIFECLGRSPYDYCSRYFTSESYRLTYSESINPIPLLEKPAKAEVDMEIMVSPPPTKRPPGRPKMKQPDSVDIIRRQLQCSKCKGLGHNKKTCNKANKIDGSDPLLLTGMVVAEQPEVSA
ncbi:putative protein isoform X2 [Capsicum chacoense]